mgnify:CR=1 FL=1
MNTSYTLHDLRNILDHMESNNTAVVNLKQLEKQLVLVPLVNSISTLIKTKANAYPVPSLRDTLSYELSPEGYIAEIIPRICLGRRSGHSTAVAKFVQDNPNENIIIVSPSAAMLDEHRKLLNLPRSSTPLRSANIQYNPSVLFVTQSNFQTHYNSSSSLIKQDPIIIVESEALSTRFLQNLPQDILKKRVIVVGN